MSGKKSLILIIVTAVLLALSNIPLVYGLYHQVPGRTFMGIVAGVRDSNFYFMMMQQARGWHVLLQNYFAPGEPATIYHGFFWALLGNLAHLFGISNLVAYHAARLTATIFFVPVTWYFVTRFSETIAERIAALLIICFGAGAGWIQMLRYYRSGVMSSVPADIGTPEATSFFTLLSFPHLSFALIFIVLVFSLLQEAISRDRMGPAFLAGLCGLALGFIHVVNLAVIYMVFAAFIATALIFKKQIYPLRPVIIFGAISVWPIAYYLYLSLIHPDLLPQAPVRSPGFISYLVGFAPLLVFSLFYLRVLRKARKIPDDDLFLLCWAAVNLLMLYSHPLISQEARAVLGLQLPLAILAAKGICRSILPALHLEISNANMRRKLLGAVVAGLLVTFTFPSTFCNIIERERRLKTYPEAFSLDNDEFEALRFLRDLPGESVVLSGDVIGNYVPGATGKRSWLGQYDLPSHDSRLQMARIIFSAATPDSERRNFLRDKNIELIYYGWEERSMGQFNPQHAPYLKQIFSNSSVAIYHAQR